MVTSPLLTVRDVMARLRLSDADAVYKLLGKELAAYRIGGRWRVSEEDLADYLRRARVGRPEPQPQPRRFHVPRRYKR